MELSSSKGNEKKKVEGLHGNSAIWASLIAICGIVLIVVVGAGLYLRKREQKKKRANKEAATVSEMSSVSNVSYESVFSIESESKSSNPLNPENTEQKFSNIESLNKESAR
ncbi:unnamed protein product [Bursaphelenchus xylophilus]|uniref:(pine wood nematode) hypothetical protein n=1 Tax=Bursaphelenchus xylophilus TaxID=6326 RepID=A0A7I8WLY7_BURXY|nr:unnamed protein product [Bursaphelenchus xylophilus]CAG9104923.1 unnamed protein product [Bursaphelenchus xylophilus]